jgi:hypothetical protein
MDKLKLIGEDAAIYEVTLGTALIGDAAQDLDDLVGGGVGSGEGWYRIVTKVDTASGLPAALTVDDWFYDDGATIIMAVGDTASKGTFQTLCDITSLTNEASKTEIDVTTICDLVKAYRSGKVELTGAFEGVRSTGGTAAAITARNKLIEQMITVVTDDGAGVIATSWDKTTPNDTLLWIFAFMYESTTSGDIEVVSILPIRLTSLTQTELTVDEKQGLNGAFRVDGGENPTEYQRTIA